MSNLLALFKRKVPAVMHYIIDENVKCAESCNAVCEKLPEATLTDIVRNNSADIRSIDNIINAIYGHLYGKPEATNAPSLGEPVCLRDEITNQSHNLVAINEKLAVICNKLGI